jgi:hypothetical protein
MFEMRSSPTWQRDNRCNQEKMAVLKGHCKKVRLAGLSAGPEYCAAQLCTQPVAR